MIRTRNLTLTSTAQEITIDDSIDTSNTISVQNTDATAAIYIGNESVTSSNYGIKLSAGQIWSADLGPNDQLFAVGTSTASILILER
jgi:hypothetical protein